MFDRLYKVAIALLLAVTALLAPGQSQPVHARTQSIAPSDHEVFFRRYRGDDEVSDHDRGQGQGRGRGRGRGGDEHGGSSGNGGGHSGGSSGGSGNSGSGDRSNSSDDADDRFGK